MNIKSLVVVFIIFTTILPAQNFIIADGHSVNINTDSSINFNGLKLTPNSPFVITGVNDVDLSSSALTVGGNSSISRVFNTSNGINNFTGTITFYYEDSELNGLDESILELQVKDDTGTWNNYVSSLDNSANVMTNTFSAAINFTDITAAERGSSLDIENFEITTIRLFPNPTASKVVIDYDGNIEVSIYNMLGQALLTTHDKIIDLSSFNNGMYLFIIKDLINNTTNSYKIIKL